MTSSLTKNILNCVRRCWFICFYFVLCMGLIIKAEIDCMNARDFSVFFCSLTEYTILNWLLIPTHWLLVWIGAPIYDRLYEATVHAEFYMLTSAVILNTAILYFALRGIRALIRRLKQKNESFSQT